MYDITTILAELMPLIGWRNSVNTSVPRLGADLLISNSGAYYNDAHPLITPENMYASCPDFDNFPAVAYSALTTYKKGDLCRHDQTVFISLENGNIGNDPTTSSKWETLFSDFTRSLTQNGIIALVDSVLLNKRISRSTKGLLQSLLIFDGSGSYNDTVIKQGRFVGFEITIRSYDSMQVVADEIGFQFTEVNELPIYLFHSSQKEALATFNLTTTKAGSFQWFKVTDFIMNFCKTGKNDAGGQFYIGYFEDDLTGQAIRKDYWFNKAPCGTCISQTYNKRAFEEWNKYVMITPVAIGSGYLNGTQLPDVEHAEFEYNNNYGMNLRLSVRCDYTDLLVANKNIFRPALQKMVAMKVLRQIAFTTRIDRIAETTRNSALLELKGDPEARITGLEKELDKEIIALEMDFSGFNSPCLADRGSGIEWGTI